MTIDALTGEAKNRIKDFIDAGIKILQDIDDLKEGLKDTSKAVGEELDIKPAVLNEALKIAYKDSMSDKKEKDDLVEEILIAAGRL